MFHSAGDFRHRVTIMQTVLGDASAYGTQARTQTAVATVWAMIQPLSGRQFEYARGFGETVSHKIVIRYRDDVTSENQIVFKGRTFTINAVLNELERNRELQLMCTEGLTPAQGS